MLPPQLQQGLRPRSLSMPATMAIGSSASTMLRGSATPASRSIWSWRRQADYASHIDPQFQRFCRYRTLKTRAKLLEKLRRRGRWDWDVNQRPFFNSKQIRLASHIGRLRWRHNEDGSEKKDSKEAAGEDGYELSQREKEWKEQMEAMRKRIEQDPYEAVFGKRLEPFWSPLVPTWMREELGLSRWPRSKDSTKPNNSSTSEPAASTDVNKARQPKRDAEGVYPNGQLTEYAYPEKKKPSASSTDPESPNGQLTSYSYSRKKPVSENPDSPNGQLTSYSYSSSTSWDSWTKKARRDEWDSISGQRRRFVYDPISNRMVQIQTPTPDKLSESNPATEDPILADSAVKKHAHAAIDVPVKTAVETRKAIPVPTNTTPASAKKPSPYFPSLLKSALVTKDSGAAAVSETPEKALDTLTANDIRASMGKAKQDRATNDAEKRESAFRDLEKEIGRIRAQIDDSASTPTTALQSSLDRMQSKALPAAVEPDDSAAHESTGESVEYGATNLPKGWETQAEILHADRIKRTRGLPRVPSNQPEARGFNKTRWIDAMTAKKLEYDAKQLAEVAAAEARNAERTEKVRKANSILEAEIKDQKLRMMAYQNRYAHGALADIQQRLQETPQQETTSESKQAAVDNVLERELERYRQKTRDLRKELDTTFKQSSINSEMHLERIRDLEREVQLARNFGHDTLQVEKDRYVQKNKALKEELERTFKQSSVNAEMQVERIRDLERELENSRSSKKAAVKGIEATRAEGDFCANVTKYAKDNSKWYKKPCYVSETTGKPSRSEVEKTQDDALVHEIKDIYEAEYGSIDTMKSEPQVVEVETDVDLGKALADYEKEQEYDFRKPQLTLEAEIAAQEKEAYEAQALLDPYPEHCVKKTQTIGEKLGLDQDVHGARIADKAPSIISNDAAAKDIKTKTPPAEEIQWEEPPVYKVLAYDSGNDRLSTAVTSSNFTGNETPISIPEALSQLYQPVRFVPHFAELQREGFQVISATKDLLVFKKVKTSSPPPALHDHGLVKENTDTAEVKSFPAGVNPIDGMTHSIEPNTGSFASPTGFVGDRWDTINAPEGQAQSPSILSKPWGLGNESQTQNQEHEDDHNIRHYPRVKREERVFSGSRLRSSKKERKREAREAQKTSETWRSVRRALAAGLLGGAVAYGIGGIVEASEKQAAEKRLISEAEKKYASDLERYRQILEGKRARWE